MTPDRTAAAIQARRRASEQKLQQVRDAVASLRRHTAPVTYPAVARQAGVSRTFLILVAYWRRTGRGVRSGRC